MLLLFFLINYLFIYVFIHLRMCMYVAVCFQQYFFFYVLLYYLVIITFQSYYRILCYVKRLRAILN